MKKRTSEKRYNTNRGRVESRRSRNIGIKSKGLFHYFCRLEKLNMKDKVVIVTGGSSGIGKALAEEFGSQGSKILITARKKELLDAARLELQQKGIIVHAIVADSGAEEDNKRVVEEALKLYGRVDVLINNAGISMRALFE